MNIFKREPKLPRIAVRKQRNGIEHYFIEVWGWDETGSYYMRDSPTTFSKSKAEKWLKDKTDKEIVFSGYINQPKLKDSHAE
jgi:hypothetical protein